MIQLLFLRGSQAVIPTEPQVFVNASLAVVLESLPKQGPSLPQAVAHKNVSVANGAVSDPESIADMTSNSKRLERALREFARHTHNDHRLWRRIVIPAKPMRVHPADCPRQPQRRAVQIDCAGLTCIACEDT